MNENNGIISRDILYRVCKGHGSEQEGDRLYDYVEDLELRLRDRAPAPLSSKKDLTFNEAFDRAQKAALDWLPIGSYSTALLREMRNGYAYGYAAALLAKDAHETKAPQLQPIFTVPKDRPLLLWSDDPFFDNRKTRFFVGTWTGQYGQWSFPGVGGLRAKYWQELPASPEKSGDDSNG